MSHAKAQSRHERRKENQTFSLLSLRLCVNIIQTDPLPIVAIHLMESTYLESMDTFKRLRIARFRSEDWTTGDNSCGDVH